MFKNALIISLITVAAVISNGSTSVEATGSCDQNRRPVPAIPATEAVLEPGEEVREEFHQTYPLSATGRLSLDNINGAVQIKVWDRNAVQVDAVKRANRKERVDEAKIVVTATEEKIRISTEYPDRDKNSSGRYDNPASVEYSLTVPRKVILESVEVINGALDIDGVEGNVKASAINGRINVRGLAGETQISTVNGSLQASFDRLEESKDIYLQSVNGSLTLVIPSNANASVRASTVHGRITNDFGLQVRHGEYVGHDLDGQIGTGGPRIKLGNVNGGIRIAHAQDGRAVSPAVSNVKTNANNVNVNADIAATVDSAVEAATAAAEVQAETQVTRAQRARVARETRRQVDVALRQAQREVARAQAEVQREVQRQVREEVRTNARRGAGAGVGSGSAGSSGSGNRFSAQETKSFAMSGVPRVNVGTFDGPITVHGWDKPEVMYTATKRGGDEEELKTITIQSEQQGSTISIIAKSAEESGSAQLDVWVPRQASLHVSTGDGQLSLDGVNGDITLRTGDGEIQVMNGGGQCQVNTGDGRILVANFQGQLDARTGDGAISLDGTFNSLSARTGDGTISLAVPAGSNFTIETTVESNVTNEGLTISEDVSPSQRVKRWKVGNGGRVFLLKTGEGTIFLRSK